MSQSESVPSAPTYTLPQPMPPSGTAASGFTFGRYLMGTPLPKSAVFQFASSDSVSRWSGDAPAKPGKPKMLHPAAPIVYPRKSRRETRGPQHPPLWQPQSFSESFT